MKASALAIFAVAFALPEHLLAGDGKALLQRIGAYGRELSRVEASAVPASLEPLLEQGNRLAVELKPIIVSLSFVARDHVNDPFVEPPEKIKLVEADELVTRRHMGVANGGWRRSAAWLIHEGKTKPALALVSAVVAAESRDRQVLADALQLAQAAGGPEAAQALARRVAAAAPASAGAQ